MKQIILIRHGESLGQTARSRGIKRNDPSLLDCFLTERGIHQAYSIRKHIEKDGNDLPFDLVCTSPLTRAVATCILGLGHLAFPEDASQQGKQGRKAIPFVCHPSLAETGGSIPENVVRQTEQIRRDIKHHLSGDSEALRAFDSIDWSSLFESPRSAAQKTTMPKSNNRNNHKKKLGHPSTAEFLSFLASRQESRILVVCHYNVIKSLLRFAVDRVPNCLPILCRFDPDDTSTLFLTDSVERASPQQINASKKKTNQKKQRLQVCA